MFLPTSVSIAKDTLDAISKSQAVIEFKPDGTIITANKNFLSAMGYTLEEIQGGHHSMFVDPAYAKSSDYTEFWKKLGRGEFDAAEYKRLGKGGKEIWIQASYNPVKDKKGTVYKVVKFAVDITASKLAAADSAGQLAAIDKALAVIQFNLDGTILTANQNFLNATGYTLDEIQGKHHRIFVDPAYVASHEYSEFWRKLGRGEFDAGQYKRIGKGGKVIWIEASYNPIFDMNGKPFKVVKYATDITRQIELMEQVQTLIDKNVGDIDQAVKEASVQASSAASAAQQSAANMQSIASGAEEMTASVQEIASSMTKSLRAVQEAMGQADNADQSTQRLDTAASAMGGIIDLIQDIAGQINLLALNATIEAARAGESGKGFAVVADEVKNLAKQAADATEQISKEIEGIQSVSSDVVKCLEKIKHSISSVESYVSGTASAVEEQTAVTQEITTNMQSASDAVRSISENAVKISQSVATSAKAVETTQEAARTLRK